MARLPIGYTPTISPELEALTARVTSLEDDLIPRVTALENSVAPLQEYYLSIPVSDDTSDLALGINQTKMKIPFDINILSIDAEVSVAPSGSSIILDVNVDDVSVMSTYKLQIDIGKYTTGDSGTQPVLTTTVVSAGSWLTIDVDQIGAGVRGKGAVVNMLIQRA